MPWFTLFIFASSHRMASAGAGPSRRHVSTCLRDVSLARDETSQRSRGGGRTPLTRRRADGTMLDMSSVVCLTASTPPSLPPVIRVHEAGGRSGRTPQNSRSSLGVRSCFPVRIHPLNSWIRAGRRSGRPAHRRSGALLPCQHPSCGRRSASSAIVAASTAPERAAGDRAGFALRSDAGDARFALTGYHRRLRAVGRHVAAGAAAVGLWAHGGDRAPPRPSTVSSARVVAVASHCAASGRGPGRLADALGRRRSVRRASRLNGSDHRCRWTRPCQ